MNRVNKCLFSLLRFPLIWGSCHEQQQLSDRYESTISKVASGVFHQYSPHQNFGVNSGFHCQVIIQIIYSDTRKLPGAGVGEQNRAKWTLITDCTGLHRELRKVEISEWSRAQLRAVSHRKSVYNTSAQPRLKSKKISDLAHVPP